MHIQRIGITERLSRVVIHNKVAYFSGLTADDRQQDTQGQTAQILSKADGFLGTISASRSSVISATIWLRDIGDFDQMNTSWVDWIDKAGPPARATVQAVLGLPDIRVEIQFVVAVSG